MKTKIVISTLIFLGVWLGGCTYFENEPPPKPPVPKATNTLEAAYTTTLPNTLTSPYWKTSNYYNVTAQDQVTGMIPADDGLFNMSGTLNGTSDFNGGTAPDLVLKAAYDDNYLYILASWNDKTYNASNADWFFDGPTDPNKAGSTTGWTSQANDDNIIFDFPISGSNVDIWKWSLSLSEPLGFAIDMIDNGSGAVADAGDKTYIRNAIGDNRSGPKYDWDGIDNQLLNRQPNNVTTILDPAYYLLNTKTIVGDASAGAPVYLNSCAHCHGDNAEGLDGPPLNRRGKFMRLSWDAFQATVTRTSHDGSSYYASLTEQERIDLYARLKGFSGVPGYILQNPTGSNSDISAISNVQLAAIDEKTDNPGYQVLMIRSLNTGNADDISFDPAQSTYEFSVFLTNNDDLNKIGATNLTLTFKPKK